MNVSEVELLSRLHDVGGEIEVIADPAVLLDSLSARFPFAGSHIDWAAVPGSVVRYASNRQNELSEFQDFLGAVSFSTSQDALVYFLGDGITDIALAMKFSTFRMASNILFSIPQHNFAFSEGFEWCLALSFEGEMGFGRSPAR